MAVAKALGSSRIIAVDTNPVRLEFAKGYVADDIYLPLKRDQGESEIEYSRRNAVYMKKQLEIEERGENSIDLVIDASGADVSIQTAFHIVKFGGTFVQVTTFFYILPSAPNFKQVGMGNPNVTLNVGLLMVKELKYKGSFRYGVGVTFQHLAV